MSNKDVVNFLLDYNFIKKFRKYKQYKPELFPKSTKNDDEIIINCSICIYNY